MRIREIAEMVGVETHVLRHWEDVGALAPRRTAQGYRDYDDEQVARARVVRRCREVGLPLPVIVTLLHRGVAGRSAVLREQIADVTRQEEELRRTRTFLEHVVGCRHGLMSRCPGCSAYADEPAIT